MKKFCRLFMPLWLLTIILSVVFCCFPVSAFCKEGSGQEKTLSRIKTVFEQPGLWVGDFVQEAHLPDIEEPVISRGTVYFKIPDCMRWEFKEPDVQLLISDGKKLWFYDASLEQVMIGEVAQVTEARLMMHLLTNLEKLQDDYQVTVYESAADPIIKVFLSPRTAEGEGRPFTSLQLFFAKQTLKLVKSQLTDLFANEIIISYSWKPPTENKLPAGFFSFVPPPGTEIVPLAQ
ncbi:MAG TPA: outer membrane lipoprotein carrier protein LolA [Proteobacteria bacterium]|nr:outer membrane lipoprotein carrier protein LolA [Pseudomonadota bacterium]